MHGGDVRRVALFPAALVLTLLLVLAVLVSLTQGPMTLPLRTTLLTLGGQFTEIADYQRPWCWSCACHARCWRSWSAPSWRSAGP
jgi:hypothetical protein